MHIIVFYFKLIGDKLRWIIRRWKEDPVPKDFDKTPFDYSRYSSTYRKMTSWRSREKAVGDSISPDNSDLPNDWKKIARKVNNWVNRNIKYVTDEENWDSRDYWSSSKETKMKGQEDCDGQAILKWRMLIDEGLPHDKLALLSVVSEKGGHMFTAIFENGEFWILDNGSISLSVQKASKTLTYTNWNLRYGFTMFNEWRY